MEIWLNSTLSCSAPHLITPFSPSFPRYMGKPLSMPSFFQISLFQRSPPNNLLPLHWLPLLKKRATLWLDTSYPIDSAPRRQMKVYNLFEIKIHKCTEKKTVLAFY